MHCAEYTNLYEWERVWYTVKKMKFEENLKTLEDLVAKMESGALSLDEMIRSFEEGRKLVETCSSELESIRRRIEKVTASGVEEMAL